MTRWLGALPLRLKLTLISVGLAAASVLAIGAVYVNLEVRAAWRGANARLVAEANNAAETIAEHPHNKVLAQRTLQELRADPEIRSASLREASGGRLSGAEEPGKAVDGSPNRSTTWLVRLTTSTLDVAVDPTKNSSATLHVDADLGAEIKAVIESCRAFILACTGIAAILAGVLLWLLRRLVSEPLAKLTQDIQKMRAGGDFSRGLQSLGNGEFGALQAEINALLSEHEGSERNLRAYKTEFERRVLERTRQLDTTVAEAREATQRSERASRAKSDFLAHMSHEIRTPLNGVLGMAELLQHSATLDERQRRYAVVIHQSGRALLQLINDVLDFSKIEAGKLELTNERFCVREMVEDALEILAERAQSKGLELICDIPVDLDTMVFGDCLRLRQIIINLVSNAVKFTEQGDVTIQVRAEIGIESAFFTFEVTDTGIGIVPENCAVIFDAFVQADTSTSRRYGGTGLGLAISKQLVALMGGTIGVKSFLGVGSTFHFSVPLAVDRTARRKKAGSLLMTRRVLIIEKSEAVRRMLRQHLKSWGAMSTEDSSASEALRRLRNAFSGEFEILILDAHLPQSSASATVAAVRKIPEFADTPILIMHTGSGDAPPEARDMKGPIAWQNKPLRRDVLQSTLEQLLKSPEAEQTEPQFRAAQTSAGAVPVEQRGLPPQRVLLVEDNPVNREVARAMLQNLGVEVHTACSGKEALEKLAVARYRAVLMDCQMPELDGYETTERYRELELRHGRPRTPVVALTANALSGDAEKCLAAGMDHYVSKPFTSEQLRTVLESCAESLAENADPQTSSEILDAKTLARIRNLSSGGRPDLLARLADLYGSSSAELVEALRVAAKAGDLTSLGRAAHALKSSSANVGATSLSATCRELELAAREGRQNQAKGLVKRLITEHREVLRALNQSAPRGVDTEVAPVITGPE